ncbi:ABC-2 type transport system ATP-binding protein [Sinosporangium album]|uniref:ABC-2 type transport system ATP-binding protein n=1 Tax=Sinosporangium album TaxID=504805 RepID=A0A1G8GIU2_9ACTN|nr:ABC transporter ATP-binding protein [Sinosporangium album]SDH94241.1 ABC-2 type transport system ATP-binding protein [Sinosporangium album]
MPILEITDLTKRYGDTLAVDGVSFSIDEGETYGLLGPNGAGKTTTISMIVGVLDRDGGEVRLDGRLHSVTNAETKALIGYVPQDLALYQDLTARENLRFFGRLYGLAGAEGTRKVGEVLEAVGLSDRANEQVAKFSGGMMRRLNIAIGLLNKPRLLILDEPTAGVDPQSRNAILNTVQQLAGEGVAVLYTTHYMEEAERLCDRVGIVDLGRMKAEGTRRELVSLVGENDRVLLKGDGDMKQAAAVLSGMPDIKQVTVDGADAELIVTDARGTLPGVFETLTRAGVHVRSVEVREPDLEAVFLHLTGKALRD